jgi:hypothetical protein
MVEEPLRDALREGEALRFESTLRTGGRLGLTDDRIVIVRSDGVETVPLENVKEVTVQSIDWFLVVLSVALAGVGLYGVIVVDDPLLGVAFVAVAVANAYLTYRKRDRVEVRLHTRSKPVTAHVDDLADVRDALKRALDAYRAEYDG